MDIEEDYYSAEGVPVVDYKLNPYTILVKINNDGLNVYITVTNQSARFWPLPIKVQDFLRD
ncbi:MAG: hypothetical protein ACI8SZ_000790 [Colwellia sp.]